MSSLTPRHNKFALSKYISSGTKINSPRSPTSYTFSLPKSIEVKEPFQATGGVPSASVPKVEYTSDKIQEMLENYNEIPKSEWLNLPIGSHIRYMKKSGDFKPGGFIRVKKNGDKSHFLLENVPFGSKSSNSNYSSWVMNFDSVSKIFAKDKNAQTQQFVPPSENKQANSFNPEIIVEQGMMQKEIDNLKKIISENNSKLSKLNEELADLTLVVRKMGKYLQSKGVDF